MFEHKLYEHKVELPLLDGEGTEWVTLRLKQLTQIPIGVLRKHRKDPEAQMWATFEWGLSDDQMDLFDRIPMGEIENIMTAWQEDDGNGLPLGGIRRLVAIIERYGEALEADLILDGLRLRHCPSPEFDWRDLSVYVRHTPLTSNLYRAMFPDKAGWTRTNMLLAEMVDSLHWLQWAKTKAGRKGRNRPKLVPRPGVTPPAREGSKPKPSPLSAIKKAFASRHPSSTSRSVEPRSERLRNLFGGM